MILQKLKTTNRIEYIAIILLTLLIVFFVYMVTRGKCEYNGSTYYFGDSFTSGDGCNACSCGANGIVCSQNKCTYNTPSSTDNSDFPKVKIYYGLPANSTDFTSIASVNRAYDKTGLELISYILTQIIAGPTVVEKTLGYTDVMQLSGNSTCDNKFFTYTINKAELTVKICKNITTKSDSKEIVTESITTSILTNMSTFTSVKVLDKDSNSL